MSGPNIPRYLAYCAAHGHAGDPDAMLAADREKWPGGVMTGFILWMGQRWSQWDAEHRHGRDHVRSPDEHAAFDAWIGGKSP